MRSDHPNAKVYREALTSSSEGPQAMTRYMADDVVWHEVDNPEPIRGKQAVADALAAATGRISLDFELYDVLADDDIAVAYGRATLRAGDRSTTYDAVDIGRMRDGLLVERWAMVGDRAAMHEFWDNL